MEICAIDGKFKRNLSILNTYAPSSNYGFSEMNDRWATLYDYIHNHHRRLIKCRRAENKIQPLQNSTNTKLNGKWTLANNQPKLAMITTWSSVTPLS